MHQDIAEAARAQRSKQLVEADAALAETIFIRAVAQRDDAFAAPSPYANCDHSTTPPTLNILDSTCFLNQFAADCP